MPDRWDVIVVGAGPVGLLAANLLGAAGLETLVVEQAPRLRPGSRAIGIMPPSLEILDTVGLGEALAKRGVRVDTARVHGRRMPLGTVRFNGLPGKRPFILAVPQDATEQVLWEGLARFPNVLVRRGVRAVAANQDGREIVVEIEENDSRAAEPAAYVLACDGDGSTLRDREGIPCDQERLTDTFVMGDYRDRSDLGEEAHLFFTPKGAVESFPLAGGVRRWIVQTTTFVKEPPDGFIEERVRERSGHRLRPEDRLGASPFGIKRQLCRPFARGRLLLAGDAAHVMPPIGGQGMNTGFADVWMAATILRKMIRDGAPSPPLLDLYTRLRTEAARAATARARLSMGIGTLRGAVPSGLRNALIWLALKTPVAWWLAPRFAMQTIPYGTIEKMQWAMDEKLR